MTYWVQCDNCNQWRIVAPKYNAKAAYTCAVSERRCSEPEDVDEPRGTLMVALTTASSATTLSQPTAASSAAAPGRTGGRCEEEDVSEEEEEDVSEFLCWCKERFNIVPDRNMTVLPWRTVTINMVYVALVRRLAHTHTHTHTHTQQVRNIMPDRDMTVLPWRTINMVHVALVRRLAHTHTHAYAHSYAHSTGAESVHEPRRRSPRKNIGSLIMSPRKSQAARYC
jgi:hypothetical protein